MDTPDELNDSGDPADLENSENLDVPFMFTPRSGKPAAYTPVGDVAPVLLLPCITPAAVLGWTVWFLLFDPLVLVLSPALIFWPPAVPADAPLVVVALEPEVVELPLGKLREFCLVSPLVT